MREQYLQNTILIKTALMFIPVQVLLDKLIIPSMSIHPGILISVSMPAHQMSKLRFPSLLQELKYLPIPPFFLSGHLHLFHQFSNYIAVLPTPVFPVFPPYAEKTRPYYAIEGKTARFTGRSGRVSCIGKGLIPNHAKTGFYCVIYNHNCIIKRMNAENFFIVFCVLF